MAHKILSVPKMKTSEYLSFSKTIQGYFLCQNELFVINLMTEQDFLVSHFKCDAHFKTLESIKAASLMRYHMLRDVEWMLSNIPIKFIIDRHL